jgi:cytochrome c
MRFQVRSFLAAALALALAACGSPPAEEGSDAASSAPAAAPSDARPAAFAQCAACHSVEPGKHGLGPSLAGVHGAKSGAATGFAYSPAMQGANLTWDDATLDEFLTAPMKKVPGTKMSYAGMADAARRKELIAYLKTLK